MIISILTDNLKSLSKYQVSDNMIAYFKILLFNYL
jgi:hypothetical protein